MFEPIQGSASKCAGKRIVSPEAAFKAAKLMLVHLGFTAATEAMRRAVRKVLAGDASAPTTWREM